MKDLGKVMNNNISKKKDTKISEIRGNNNANQTFVLIKGIK